MRLSNHAALAGPNIDGGQRSRTPEHGRTREDILSFVECTTKLCADYKMWDPSLISERLWDFWFWFSSAATTLLLLLLPLLLEDLYKVDAVLDDEPSDCDTQMNVIKQ